MPIGTYDVAVIGAGIAGLAASVLLRQEGLRVVCLDPRPHPHRRVGESLDWSSPALIARLGIDGEALLADGSATSKRKIVACELGREPWTAMPPQWIRHAPARFETVTLHVDRAELDLRIFERARELGTSFVWERVTGVEHERGRVKACITSAGAFEARFTLDASGAARVLSREMGIPVTTYGRPKVCLWTYFDTPPLTEGTTFFVDNRNGYLEWIWDIPISPRQTSVGYVLAADTVRERRRAGASPEAIFYDALARHPRFAAPLEGATALQVERTAFHCSVTTEVCGANWLLIGEAASMPDPLTGNGVTSGIRHARHAVECILRARASGEIAPAERRTYSRHVHRLGRSFNAHIESALYRPTLRQAFGLETATTVYTGFAFVINALVTRFDPRGRLGMAAFALLFAAARAWIGGWTLAGRAVLWRRGVPPC